MTTDHLGSPRVITDAEGEVTSRRDFMPFGEELGAGVGGRTTNLKYSTIGSEQIRQRFTGYEKDDETQLDFAEARMYQNKHGRFTAPDPLLASASAVNPQTFNRYIYTGNNPINYIDPSGLTFCKNDSSGMITWNGEVGKTCAKGSTSVDGQTLELGNRSSGFTSDGVKIKEGLHVTFNRDGTTVGESAAQYAERTGTNVQATQGDLLTTSAAEISTNITPRQADGLPPCSMCDGDGSTSWSNPLAEAAKDAPELKTITATKETLKILQLIPGANVAATTLLIIFEGGGGNGSEAASELPNLVPGLSWFRKANRAASSGRNIAERLFLSERFGITSNKFANSITGVTGAWNQPKSLLKIGWSSTRNQGGGMQLRIGLGYKGNGNKAWKHIYIPKTFVPNSFANPSIQLKRWLGGRLGGRR